jgi:hypothetical protein
MVGDGKAGPFCEFGILEQKMNQEVERGIEDRRTEDVLQRDTPPL